MSAQPGCFGTVVRSAKRWVTGPILSACALCPLLETPAASADDAPTFQLRQAERTDATRRALGTLRKAAAPDAADVPVIDLSGPAVVPVPTPPVAAPELAAEPVETKLDSPVPLETPPAFLDLSATSAAAGKPAGAGRFTGTPAPVDPRDLPVIPLDGDWELPPIEVGRPDIAVRMASFEESPAVVTLADLGIEAVAPPAGETPGLPPLPETDAAAEPVFELTGVDLDGNPRSVGVPLGVAGPRLVATMYAAELSAECGPADRLAYRDFVPADVMAELTALAGEPVVPAAVSSGPAAPVVLGEPVVAKADPEAELFPADIVPWLQTAEPLLDLRPGEPIPGAPTYLDDLQALIPTPAAPAPEAVVLLTTDDWQPTETVPVAAKADPDREAYVIPPAPDCPVVGGASVAELFTPLSRVTVTGTSTAPPSRPVDDADTDDGLEDLERPEDLACVYLGDAAPGYYSLPPQTHVTSPFRDTVRIRHRPLYFSDPNLELCGQTQGCLTTARAASLFFAQTVLLPYQMGRLSPCSCVEALPDCPTCSQFGKDAYLRGDDHQRGVAYQAAATTGLLFMIP